MPRIADATAFAIRDCAPGWYAMAAWSVGTSGQARSRRIGDLPKTHLALVELPSNLVFRAIKRKSDNERKCRIGATAMVMVRVGNRWGSGVGDVSKLRKLDPRALAAWGWDDLIWKRKNGWERRSPFDLGGPFDAGNAPGSGAGAGIGAQRSFR